VQSRREQKEAADQRVCGKKFRDSMHTAGGGGWGCGSHRTSALAAMAKFFTIDYRDCNLLAEPCEQRSFWCTAVSPTSHSLIAVEVSSFFSSSSDPAALVECK